MLLVTAAFQCALVVQMARLDPRATKVQVQILLRWRQPRTELKSTENAVSRNDGTLKELHVLREVVGF